MALRFYILSLLALFAAASAGSHNAPAPAADCSSLVLNMADCLSFVTSGSTAKKPEGTCCSGLKTVLKSDAECLCEAFKNSAQLGVQLNVTKALTLPAACHVSAPSVSNCELSPTGAAPAFPPVALSPSGVAGAPTATIGPDEISPAPAPSPGNSGAASLVASAGLLVVTIAAVALSFF